MQLDDAFAEYPMLGRAYCLLRVGLVAEAVLGMFEYIRMGFGALLMWAGDVRVLDRVDHFDITVPIGCMV